MILLKNRQKRIQKVILLFRVLPNHFLMICTHLPIQFSYWKTWRSEPHQPKECQTVKKLLLPCTPVRHQLHLTPTCHQNFFPHKTFLAIYIFLLLLLYSDQKKKLYILHTGGPCFKRILFMWSHSTWALNFHVRKFILHETAQNTKFV